MGADHEHRVGTSAHSPIIAAQASDTFVPFFACPSPASETPGALDFRCITDGKLTPRRLHKPARHWDSRHMSGHPLQRHRRGVSHQNYPAA